jgi:hypothetical protein
MKTKYDLLGGLLIVISIGFAATEYALRQGTMQIFDFFPYAMWMIIGLVVASLGDECEDE